MRLSYPNLTRPKKSAKVMARLLGLPLSVTQTAIASGCGYQDWHDFELNHAKGSPFALDQHLGQERPSCSAALSISKRCHMMT